MTVHRRLVHFVSRLVPRRLRPEWVREWEAELGYREARLAALSDGKRPVRWELFRRSAGSIWDALAMQPRRLEEDVYQDVHYGLRTMWRQKGWTSVVVLSLAIGIGANTALFSVIDAALLQKLPVTEPDELVFFEGTWTGQRPYTSYNGNSWMDEETGLGSGTSFPYGTFERFRTETETLSGVIAFARIFQSTLRVGTSSQPVEAQVVSGDYFSVLGVPAALGRPLVDADNRATAEPAAVISHRYWQRQFGSDPGAIGRTVVLNGLPLTIVGVSAPGFTGTHGFGTTADIWIPMAFEPRGALDAPSMWWLQIMGRMRVEGTLEQVHAELNPIFQTTAFDSWTAAPAEQRPASASEWTAPELRVRSGSQGIRDTARNAIPLLSILTAVCGLLLLIVCVNVANLLLARSAGRWREIGTRLAVGASRRRLVRQMLTETIVLAGIAGIVGVAFAYWGKELIAAVVALDISNAAIDPDIDLRVLAFVAAVSLLTAILFGLAPALIHTRWSAAQSVLRSSDRNPVVRSRFNRLLMVMQVAMSVVLLIGAGLFLRTLDNLRSVDVGFNPENLLVFQINPQTLQYDEPQIARLYDAMFRQIDRIPGILAVTLSEYPLVSDSGSSTFAFVGSGGPDDRVLVRLLRVEPNFLSTMGIPVRRGRDFADTDDANAPRVAIINETLAHADFPDTNPVGRTVGLGLPSNRIEYEIIGVAGDASISSLQRPATPAVYLSRLQRATESAHFLIRTAGDPTSLVPLIRESVSRIDPNVPLIDIRTQAQQIENGFATELLLARASTAFGAIALFLAALGLYGLMSHNVASRVPEIGIRMALGARRGQVLRMVMQDTSRMILVGILLGLAGAYAATRFIASLLYGLEPNDPATITAAIALLLTTAVVAAFLPARRASRVDPMVALRHE